MNNIKLFENPDFGSVRAVEMNGEPYFIGKDVADALGYKDTKSALIDHVDEDDKRILKSGDLPPLENHIPKSAFPANLVSADIPNRGLTIINESGLYSLILSSKLPKAKEFKHWVTSEILPSIRKHGAFMTPDVLSRAISDPDFMIGLFAELKVEQQKRKQLETEAEENRPKVLFAKAVETSHTSILIGDLAKLIKQNGVDIGQKRLFAWLRENGYLIKSGSSTNMPTQRAMEMKLFEVKERSISNPDGSVRVTRTTKVTGKGQTYFINLFLKESGGPA